MVLVGARGGDVVGCILVCSSWLLSISVSSSLLFIWAFSAFNTFISSALRFFKSTSSFYNSISNDILLECCQVPLSQNILLLFTMFLVDTIKWRIPRSQGKSQIFLQDQDMVALTIFCALFFQAKMSSCVYGIKIWLYLPNLMLGSLIGESWKSFS